MEKPLKFKEIIMPYPNLQNTYTDYDKKLQPRMDFEPAALEQFYLTHKEELIETVVKECERYLDADDWMEEETFPRIKELTGEWYLASVTVRNQKGRITVQLYLHFLGYCPGDAHRKKSMIIWAWRRGLSTIRFKKHFALTAAAQMLFDFGTESGFSRCTKNRYGKSTQAER